MRFSEGVDERPSPSPIRDATLANATEEFRGKLVVPSNANLAASRLQVFADVGGKRLTVHLRKDARGRWVGRNPEPTAEYWRNDAADDLRMREDHLAELNSRKLELEQGRERTLEHMRRRSERAGQVTSPEPELAIDKVMAGAAAEVFARERDMSALLLEDIESELKTLSPSIARAENAVAEAEEELRLVRQQYPEFMVYRLK